MSEEEKQALTGLCKIEIKRWKAASESNPNMRYMAKLMEIALAALTAQPVAWISSGEQAIFSRLKKHSAVEVGLFNVQRFSDDTPLFTSAPIPTGWKVVPIEPTERMVIAGFESELDEDFSEPEVWEAFQKMSGCQQAAYKARLCWAAMLAAAPEVE
ncbi:hypothetical protein [[Curtobacterium] plantarum]|uniref:Recombinase n=1 Tax=[Curtobacterium] plantarum TaxID=221276 RepID=A0ABT9T6F7_9GAMM|nr:hypothetical protein [[Curtobacterium] plantarum]MDQ0019051.1 hypothetical protein [[Curtobacterium] plantarum]